MNSLEIDYEEMIKEIKEQNPKNIHELIYAILAITGVGSKRKQVFNVIEMLEIIKPLDQQLLKIAFTKGGGPIGYKTMVEYNKTHNIKVDLSDRVKEV
jgi:hypothetical protein